MGYIGNGEEGAYEPELLVLVDDLDAMFIVSFVRRIADGSEVGVAVHGELVESGGGISGRFRARIW